MQSSFRIQIRWISLLRRSTPGQNQRTPSSKRCATLLLSYSEVSNNITSQIGKDKKKVDEDEPSFSASIVTSRYAEAGISAEPVSTNCSKEIQDVVVERSWMSKEYGGNTRQTFPKISQQKFEHGYNDFMYIVPRYSAVLPEVPGAPGIWVTTKEDDHHCDVRRLFSRISASPARWQYMGQYELRRAHDLSPDEWQMQSIEACSPTLYYKPDF